MSVTKIQHLYLDMDGVIADFYTLLSKWFKVDHWKEIRSREEILERLKGSSFFSEIPVFSNTYLILDIVDYYTEGNWSILSTPLEGDFENSVKHKDIWLDRVLEQAGIETIRTRNRFYSHKKWEFAEPNTVLIDDRPQNIDDFIKAGGLGIRFQANESYLSKLVQKLENLYR
tara:strand:- start:43 stop:558 length:516 start_codon:yes stop_codon:yes gene_type:complete